MKKQKKFYVYAILVDGKIKYIGKGKGYRVRRHMVMVQRIIRRRAAGEVVRTTHFYNKLSKAWRSGSKIEERILHDGLSEKAALKLEIIEIAKRRKRLWNIQAGGEHMNWDDPDFRKAVTRKMRKAWRNPERIKNHLELMKRIHSDPKHKKKISKIRKSLNLQPEFRAATIKRNKSKKMRDANKRKNWSPERLAAHLERLKLINLKRWGNTLH